MFETPPPDYLDGRMFFDAVKAAEEAKPPEVQRILLNLRKYRG